MMREAFGFRGEEGAIVQVLIGNGLCGKRVWVNGISLRVILRAIFGEAFSWGRGTGVLRGTVQTLLVGGVVRRSARFAYRRDADGTRVASLRLGNPSL